MIKNVTILGGGVLGSQIAFQTAFTGHNTTIYLRTKESIKKAKLKLENVKNSYIDAINTMKNEVNINTWSLGIVDFDDFNYKKTLKRINETIDNIKLEMDLSKSLKDADLVIESMTEDFNAKKEIYQKIARILDDKTILVTNSSTFLTANLQNTQNEVINF